MALVPKHHAEPILPAAKFPVPVAFIAGFLVFFLLLQTGCGGQFSRTRPMAAIEGSFEQITIHRGTLDAGKKNDIGSPLMTQLKSLAEDGARVKRGDVIAELVVAEQEEELASKRMEMAQAQVALKRASETVCLKEKRAEANIRKMRVELEQKKVEFEKAVEQRDWQKILEFTEDQKLREFEKKVLSRKLEAQQKLTSRGFSPPTEVMDTRRELARLQLEASNSAVILPWLKKNGVEKDIFAAWQAMELASAALRLAEMEAAGQSFALRSDLDSKIADRGDIASEVGKLESDIASAVIRAEADGLVVRKGTYNGVTVEKVGSGDRVFPGIKFLSILNTENMGVEFLVDQRDSGTLATGQVVRFRLDAYPERAFSGVVSECSLFAEEGNPENSQGERVLRTRARLDAVPSGPRVGYSGVVELITKRVDDAVLIPRELLEPASGTWVARPGCEGVPTGLVFLGCMDQWIAFKGGQSPGSTPLQAVRQVMVKPMSRSLTIPGEVKARRRSLLASTFSGRVATILDDGAPVKAGDIVARLDTNEIEKALTDLKVQEENKREQFRLLIEKQKIDLPRNRQMLQNAEWEMKTAQMEHHLLLERKDQDKILTLKKTLGLIESKLQMLRENAALEQDLVKRGLKSELDLENTRLEIRRQEREKTVNQSKLDYEVSGPGDRQIRLSRLSVAAAEEKLNLARIDYDLATFEAAMDVESQKADLEKMRLDRDAKERQMKESSVASPQDGVVILPETYRTGQFTRVKPGEQVHGQVPFAHIADMKSLEVRFEIPEMDAKFLDIGKPVEISLKSAPGKIFPGRIRQIGTVADVDQFNPQDVIVEVFAALEDGSNASTTIDPGFRPGGSCEVKIVLYDRPNAVVVPFEALIPGATATWVLGEDGRKIPFVPDFSDGLNGVVASQGLIPGQKILVPWVHHD